MGEMQAVSMRELLATEFPDESLVSHGLLARRSKLLLGGDAKSGKSYLILEMVIELATGRPFLQTFEVKEPLKVLLWQFEVSPAIVQKRYRMYTGVWGDAAALDNVWIVNTRDFRIDEESGMDAMDTLLTRIKPDVTVCDPLYYMHSADENSTQAMTEIVRKLDWVAEQYNTAIILVHHKRKPQMDSRGGRIKGGVADFRGSSVLWGWPDTILDVVKRNQYQGVDIDFTVRDFEEPLSTLKMDWQVTGVPLKVVEDSQPQVGTAVVLKLVKEWESPFLQSKLLKVLTERSSPSTATRTITKLVADGVLVQVVNPDDKRSKMLRMAGRE